MGLGLLFFGYLFCLNILNVYFLPFSAGIMFWALKKLSFVNPTLSHSKTYLIPLFFVGLAGGMLAVVDTFLLKMPFYSTLAGILTVLGHLLMLVFLFFLFRGLRELATEVSLPKLAAKALRNQVFCFFYFVPAVLLELPVWDTSLFLQTASLFTVLLGLIIFILNATTLYDFYRLVCMPGQE